MAEWPQALGAEAFRQDAAFWRGLFDIHLDPLAFIDSRFRIVRANLALAKALGCSQEEVEGRFCHEVFHGEACAIPDCPHVKLLADGCEHACEATLDRLGGSYWISVTPVFDNTGLLIGCLHIARNVTAYKTLEAELRTARNEVEARAEARAVELKEHMLFEQVLVSQALNLGKAISDVDANELIQQGVRDVGRAGRFGRCVFLKVADETVSTLAVFEDSQHALSALPVPLTHETAPWIFGVLGERGVLEESLNGVERYVVSMRPLWVGDPAYVLLAERNVSVSPTRMALSPERLRLVCHVMGGALRRQAGAKEAQRLREELSHLDRMARLGQLTATLAHELNQPLAATLCNAQAAAKLLRQPQPDVAEACSALDDIVASARRAGDVMRQTRALFKGGDQPLMPVDMQALITAVLKLLRDEVAFAGAVVVRQGFGAYVPPVLGNVVQLQQVLINLLRNAVDAVRPMPEKDRTITVSLHGEANERVVLGVTDTGMGFGEGEEELIFQSFFTKKADGMGMGLPICRQIVKHHGGTISARRMPEGGACFTVILPASADPVKGSGAEA